MPGPPSAALDRLQLAGSWGRDLGQESWFFIGLTATPLVPCNGKDTRVGTDRLGPRVGLAQR